MKPNNIHGFQSIGGYHILYNNCEHFANECVSGVQICRQAEDVRALFRNMPVVDVYIAALPENMPIGDVACKERRDEIAAVSNERVKREKYFVWKLLCYALERSFGMRGERLAFRKEGYGGWSCGEISLSLSHSNGALAVAVSRREVGIDIEAVEERRNEGLAERIMTAAELSEYEKAPQEMKDMRLVEIWTKKEALFKSMRSERFVPQSIDTLSGSLCTESVTLKGTKYVCSVATPNPERIRIFKDIDSEKLR